MRNRIQELDSENHTVDAIINVLNVEDPKILIWFNNSSIRIIQPPVMPANPPPLKSTPKYLVQWLRSLTILAEDQSSKSNTHVRWLTAVFNHRWEGSDPSDFYGTSTQCTLTGMHLIKSTTKEGRFWGSSQVAQAGFEICYIIQDNLDLLIFLLPLPQYRIIGMWGLNPKLHAC